MIEENVKLCRRTELFKAVEVKPETIVWIHENTPIHLNLESFFGDWIVIDKDGNASIYTKSGFDDTFEIVEV